jgi:hypothetical protein
MIVRLMAAMRTIGPVRAAFMASLLLSWIALGGALINRDGIFYVDAARADGIRVKATASTAVPVDADGRPVGLDGLAPTSKHLLNAFFLAGPACFVVITAIARRKPPGWHAWSLAMPAYNSYRGELLREYGWFFCLLAFWLACAGRKPRRARAPPPAALGIAALFRPGGGAIRR